MTRRAALGALAAACGSGCGYHVGGRAEIMPKTVRTIAIPAFRNATVRYRLGRLLPADIGHEFLARTRYVIVADHEKADAVLTGELTTVSAGVTVSDQSGTANAPASGRGTAAQIVVTLNLRLTDRHTGKVLFSRQGAQFWERYEIALDPETYFDESSTAVDRLSRDVAREVVSAILEDF